MIQQAMRWGLLLIVALIPPSLYGLFMVSIDTDTSSLGDTVPILGYSLCLMVGGVLGAIGCIGLSVPRWQFRVLLGATLFVFVSEIFRGFSILADSFLNTSGELGVITTFLYHASSFLVLAFGSLIFIGSTKWGKRKGLLVQPIFGKSQIEQIAEVSTDTHRRVKNVEEKVVQVAEKIVKDGGEERREDREERRDS